MILKLVSEIKLKARLIKLAGDPQGIAEMCVRARAHLWALSKLDGQVCPDEHLLGVGESQIPGTVDRGFGGGIPWEGSVQSEEPDRAWG